MANTGENRNTIADNVASTGRIMIDVIIPLSNGEDLLQFRINNSTKLNKVFKAYLDRRPTNVQVQFLYYDRQSSKQIPLDVDSEMTPTLLGMCDGDSIVCVPLWLKHLHKFRQDMKDKEPCLLVSNGSKLKELQYLLARDAPEYMEEFNRELDKCLREKIYINVGNTDGREITTFLISKSAKMGMLFDAYMKHHSLGETEGFTFHNTLPYHHRRLILAYETPGDFLGAAEGQSEVFINIYNKKDIFIKVSKEGSMCSAPTFYMKNDSKMGNVLNAYAHKQGVDRESLIFHHYGEHIEANNTPRDFLASYELTESKEGTISCSEADLSIGSSDCIDIYLNEKTISFLKQNDHRFTSLIVEENLYLNPSVDWIGDGMCAIGNNTSLKRVAFSRLYFGYQVLTDSDPEVFYAFCRASID